MSTKIFFEFFDRIHQKEVSLESKSPMVLQESYLPAVRRVSPVDTKVSIGQRLVVSAWFYIILLLRCTDESRPETATQSSWLLEAFSRVNLFIT